MDQSNRSAARLATLAALPLAVLAGLLVYWLLGGFGPSGGDGQGRPHGQATAPVSVPAPALGEPAATVCRTLVERLPDTVNGSPRRPVTSGDGQNAAYGDPPVVLSCGTTPPAIPPDAQLIGLSGVCWWPEDRSGSAVWTTVGRQVPVQVTVPKTDEGSSQWVIDFVPAISSAVPLAASAPASC
jgi:Protein of unknown function (DUF3515)